MDVFWVRRDARTCDNAALSAAVEESRRLHRRLCILFVFDERWIKGSHCHASHCEFVFQGLSELNCDLKKGNADAGVLICDGLTEDVLACLHAQTEIRNLWSHVVVGDAELQEISAAVQKWCNANDVQSHAVDQYGIVSEGRLRNGKSIFAQSFEQAMSAPLLPPPDIADIAFIDAAVDSLATRVVAVAEACKTSDWRSLGVDGNLRPFAPHGGESKAQECLDDFLTRRGLTYASGLSSPLTAWDSCSRISAYLAWGHISLRTVVQRTKRRQDELRRKKKENEGEVEVSGGSVEIQEPNSENEEGVVSKTGIRKDSWLRSLQNFQSRLRWRTHFMQKLFDEPRIATENMASGYDGMRQEDFSTLSPEEKFNLEAWLYGQTGYPFVDACMRALHDSGWINFRMRCMLVSFASYELWLSWKHIGPQLAKLFVDYEPGIHYPQLQMQSGTTGINSNRIYDSCKQMLDHDPSGEFTQRYVPELLNVPVSKLIKGHKIDICGYPNPIVKSVDARKLARERLREYNRRVKRETNEGSEIFQKHGSRRPNAGDLQRSTRSSAQANAKRPRLDSASAAQENDVSNSEKQRGIIVEHARSSRSSCRCCQEKIEKGAARCGLEVRKNARWETRWCHAQCYLSTCTRLTRYRGNRAATCRGSSKLISKGDLIVRFIVGDASCNMLPEAAKAKISEIVKLVGLENCKAWIREGGEKPSSNSQCLPQHELELILERLLPSSESPCDSTSSHARRTFEQLQSTHSVAPISLGDSDSCGEPCT